jgi:hypothetical protein
MTDRERWLDVCAAAEHLLSLQGDLVVNKNIVTDRERREKTDYWYASQLRLAEKLAEAGWGRGRLNEAELKASREAFEKVWRAEQKPSTRQSSILRYK